MTWAALVPFALRAALFILRWIARRDTLEAAKARGMLVANQRVDDAIKAGDDAVAELQLTGLSEHTNFRD